MEIAPFKWRANRFAPPERKPGDFRIVGEVLWAEPIAIMLRKDDPEFKKTVDDALLTMMRSGDIGDLCHKWFMQPIAPSNTRLGLAPGEATRAAWSHPSDKPLDAPAQP